jgi:tetratricopeptide (TPR) repeat protein
VAGSGFWVLGSGNTPQKPEPKTQNLAVLDALRQLRERSLLLADEVGGDMRFRMLETLREFAAEQLTTDEREAVSRRHAHYFLALAEQIEPKLFEAEQATWLERLEAEHDNLRAALAWCSNNDVEAGLRLAAALLQLWFVRGYIREGREWMENLLRRAESVPLAKGQSAPSSVMAKAICRAGFLAWYADDYEQADVLCERSLKIYRELKDDKEGMAFNLCGIAATALTRGDYARAQAACEESLSLWREIGNQWGAAMSLYSLARVRLYQEEYAQSRALFEETIALLHAVGRMQDVYVAWSLCCLGHVGLAQGDYEQAQAWLEESLPLFRQLGHKWGTVASLVVLGSIAFLQKDVERAQWFLRESLAVFKERGTRRGVHLMQCLELMAGIAHLRGQTERAARLFGAVEVRQHDPIILSFPLGYFADCQCHLNAARAALRKTASTAAWAEGRALTIEQAIAAALEE